MDQLIDNLTRLDIKRSQQWIASLKNTIDALADKWQLTDISPVENMMWNYIATASSERFQSVCLKISMDEGWAFDEWRALKHFRGQGMIKVYDFDRTHQALLLEQATPGSSLKSLYPVEETRVMSAYAGVVQNLSHVTKDIREKGFRHLRDWLKVFDRINEEALPPHLVTKAKDVGRKLLEAGSEEGVLHGDLHLDNILCHRERWLAIDPKGIVGPRDFDVACFDFVTDEELLNERAAIEHFQRRVAQLSQMAAIDPTRLSKWVFIRLMLGACWMIEDNGDVGNFLKRLNIFFPEEVS